MSRCWTVFIDLRGDPSISWIWMPVSLPRLWKFSARICLNTYSGPLSLSAPSETPIKRRFYFLRLSFISLNLSSWSFNCLSLFSSVSLFAINLSSMSLTHSSTSLTLIFRISSLDCISFNWFFISAWLDLNSAVIKSLESFMLFSRATNSCMIVLLNWLSDIEL